MIATQIYDRWPIVPTLPEPTALFSSGLSTRFTRILREIHDRTCDVIGEDFTEATLYTMSGGRRLDAGSVEWLSQTYPQASLNYLFYGIGQPVLGGDLIEADTEPSEAPLLLARLRYLRHVLTTEIYPALEADENTIWINAERGVMHQHSHVALAVNLHREFVETLGPNQAAWWGYYWQELEAMTQRLFGAEGLLPRLWLQPQFVDLVQRYHRA